jgi:hypothetical protein
MALPLNVYKTPKGVVPTTPEIIYTAPVGYTGVVLMGQVSNIGNTTQRVLFSIVGINTVEITPNSPVPGEDSIKLFSGKMFILSGDSLIISGSHPTNLKYYFSILETLN